MEDDHTPSVRMVDDHAQAANMSHGVTVLSLPDDVIILIMYPLAADVSPRDEGRGRAMEVFEGTHHPMDTHWWHERQEQLAADPDAETAPKEEASESESSLSTESSMLRASRDSDGSAGSAVTTLSAGSVRVWGRDARVGSSCSGGGPWEQSA